MAKKKIKNKIKGKLINYGFDVGKIKIEPEEWIGGALLGEEMNPSGDWTEFLPLYEPQAEKFETWGCVTFGATSQIEILMKYLQEYERT